MDYKTISIHALREEGDRLRRLHCDRPRRFLSTPSARRATWLYTLGVDAGKISIHALREEGDSAPAIRPNHTPYFYPRPPRGGRRSGDSARLPLENFYPRPPRGGRPALPLMLPRWYYFYPRPPRGGRRRARAWKQRSSSFLSTPSARRATLCRRVCGDMLDISIHALREEGDPARTLRRRPRCYFYPRPPRGGRPCLSRCRQ